MVTGFQVGGNAKPPLLKPLPDCLTQPHALKFQRRRQKECTVADPTPKQLLEKLAGKRIILSTRCGTFSLTDGVIQQVFDDFELKGLIQSAKIHFIAF